MENTTEKKPNGEYTAIDGETEESSFTENSSKGMINNQEQQQGVTLLDIFNRFVSAIFSNNDNNDRLIQRIKSCISENLGLVGEASKNSAQNVYCWTRKGTPLRALLVVSVGTITLLALTGLLVFLLFFVTATVNAIVISLLLSLAAAGGFLALFFACLTAIYVGALAAAVFVISATTITAVVAVIVATGWIGFFWTIWLATKKSASLAKHSLSVTGSALSAYSSTRHFRHNHDA